MVSEGMDASRTISTCVTKFFNKHWAPLTESTNDKNNLLPQHLAAASGIPTIELRYYDPRPLRVDEKMCWAARRKTTRGEDMAYSLMGIFDVTLQPAYGEGAKRAFRRLTDMILHSSGDNSVLNCAGKAANLHNNSNTLPSSPRCYLGHPSINQLRSLHVAMTNRGLRIPLVVLPMATRSTRSAGSGTRKLNVRCLDKTPETKQGRIRLDFPTLHPPLEP